MPKVNCTVTIDTEKPIPTKDMEDFIHMSFKNQLARFSPESNMFGANVVVSELSYSEKVAEVSADDQSGTVDSEDVKNETPVDDPTEDEDPGSAEDNGTEEIEKEEKPNPFAKK